MVGTGNGAGGVEAGSGEQAPAAKGSGCTQRRPAGRTTGAIFVGTVAGVHRRGVCAQVQRVRRAGTPDWLHHRASHGVTDTAICRQASNWTDNRTSALTAGEGECTAADRLRIG